MRCKARQVSHNEKGLWERFMKLPCSNILLKCQRVEWNRRGNQYENLSCFMWHTGDGCIDVEEFSSVCSSFGIDAGEARKAFETLSKVSEKAQNDASSASIFYCAPPPKYTILYNEECAWNVNSFSFSIHPSAKSMSEGLRGFPRINNNIPYVNDLASQKRGIRLVRMWKSYFIFAEQLQYRGMSEAFSAFRLSFPSLTRSWFFFHIPCTISC